MEGNHAFFVHKNQLVNALQHVQKAVSSKTTIPILTGIKFDIGTKGLIITGSDSDISIQVLIPLVENGEEWVQLIIPGKIVVPAKYILEIVKKLPGEMIEFEVIDHFTIIIKSGSSEFRLNGFDADEYPNLPQIIDEEEHVFTIPSDLLKMMIRQTQFAVSTIESRPILTGVLWNLENQVLKFTATDSHRLAVREATVESLTNLSFQNVVIPGRSLSELSKILDDTQTPVEIIVNENQILIKMNHVLFLSRLLDGTYPDTSRIIPDKYKTKIIIQTKKLLESIERASLLARDGKNNIVKFTNIENLLIEVSSNSPEVGNVTDQLQIKNIEGEPVKISFNAKYMLDALRAIDSEEVQIEFTGALSPFVIKPIEHHRILQLILPVRTY
ncbi:DNA polymerase III subunit beta [Tepidibacillus decaturensis]|uniref:Beta sliding clamp n=1 Tax=Tepidibacillus decaturensis TaxID=1413211 RepID=A0A135L7Z0_9BACI|nr:DNA polymerase III subunit beta [Tepidibacillus decaturensis]KXG45098.1 DNA polymerase III subunit beta [Tepidibacillus decaturensis]